MRLTITDRRKSLTVSNPYFVLKSGTLKLFRWSPAFESSDVNQLILENYSDPEFHIEKLVDLCCVSRTVFYHKIKSLTGLSPIDFLRQKRLHIAAQMIIESDYNISEIAILSGFNDAKNFSKRFKEIYNMTPSQYKEETLAQKVNEG